RRLGRPGPGAPSGAERPRKSGRAADEARRLDAPDRLAEASGALIGPLRGRHPDRRPSAARREGVLVERTLTIVKPDAVSAGKTGAILAQLEREGFRILALRKLRLSLAQARAFYAVHRQR